MMMGRKPPYIKNDVLSSAIDNDNVPRGNRLPEYATYDEWNDLGFYVMEGEKSNIKLDGVPVFHRDQVSKKRVRNYQGCDDDGYYDELYYDDEP